MNQKKTPTIEKIEQSGSVNYAAEKARVESSVKKWKRIAVFCIVCVLLAFCIFGAFVDPSSWKYYFSLPEIDSLQAGECRVHFLDVGQGDCTVIEFPDGQTAMIDGGSPLEDVSGYILRYLNALDIDTIDLLLVTHADEDHCGGLSTVLQYKKVGKVLLPKADILLNTAYADFCTQLQNRKIAWAYATRTASTIEVNECVFSILYPYINTEQENENNEVSAVVWLDYHGISVLFTGDMPTETENVLMRDESLGIFEYKGVDLSSTEILKVSHHGSRYQTSEEFLQYLHLKTAIISCGENNAYGHPHAETLDRLNGVNAKTYRTDQHGSIIVTMENDGTYTVDFLKKE